MLATVKAKVEVATRSLSVGVAFGRSWEVPHECDLSKLYI